jgi:pimeloyl-ACP methyl ester carboxylesterase
MSHLLSRFMLMLSKHTLQKAVAVAAEQHLVVFAHGRDSGPWGTKITALAEVARQEGYAVLSPDYSHTTDPKARLAQLLKNCPHPSGHLVLVGSSMGGYVSAAAASQLQVSGLFLMAPALYFGGYELPGPVRAPHCVVIHGWRDAVIPVEVGIRFAREHHAELIVLDDDHSLTGQMDILTTLFAQFLGMVLRSIPPSQSSLSFT